MTITLNKTTKKFIITLESNYFTNSPKKLKSKHNCCESIESEGNVSPISYNVYEYPWNEQDGIFNFSISETVGGNVYTEQACIFVYEKLICVILDYIKKEENMQTNVHLLFELIKEGVNCQCNCEDLCLVYKQILLELDILNKCKIC